MCTSPKDLLELEFVTIFLWNKNAFERFEKIFSCDLGNRTKFHWNVQAHIHFIELLQMVPFFASHTKFIETFRSFVETNTIHFINSQKVYRKVLIWGNLCQRRSNWFISGRNAEATAKLNMYTEALVCEFHSNISKNFMKQFVRAIINENVHWIIKWSKWTNLN